MKQVFAVLTLFLLIIGAYTHPLYKKCTTHLPGISADQVPYATLWDSWRIRKAYQGKLSLRETDLIGYPYKNPVLAGGLQKYIGSGLRYAVSFFLPPAAVWNLQLFLNLALSALVAYFLAAFVTSSKLAGVFAGIAFALSPYHFFYAPGKIALTNNAFLPLMIFAALRLYSAGGWEATGWFILSVILFFSFNYSIGFIGMAALIVLVVYVVFHFWRVKYFGDARIRNADGVYLKKLILLTVAAIVPLIPQFRKSFDAASLMRPAAGIADVNGAYSAIAGHAASPVSYYLPSPLHPVFGAWAGPAANWGAGAPTLFLGWSVIALAAFAVARWAARKSAAGTALQQFYTGFFILLGIAGWAMSQPPYLAAGRYELLMPSALISKYIPGFIEYGRFGLLLILSSVVLAAFTVKRLTAAIPWRFAKPVPAVVFSACIAFEFWMTPPARIVDVSRVPDAYVWLKEQSGNFAVAEYPLKLGGDVGRYLFYQTVHGKKLVNGAREGTKAYTVGREITFLSNPRTAGILAWMGVRYVIVHRDAYERSGVPEDKQDLALIPGNGGLTLVKSFPAQSCVADGSACTLASGPIDVYIVIADPVEVQTAEDDAHSAMISKLKRRER